MAVSISKSKGNAKPALPTVTPAQLQQALDGLLEPHRFNDYCPNGLQVQGREAIGTLISGVTASQRFLEAAVAAGAHAVLVHHGWFWRGEDPRIIGARHRRLATLMQADVNLFAYHLPLDAHPELGNNAQLAARLAWPIHGRTGRDELVFWGDLATGVTPTGLARQLADALGRAPLMVGEPPGRLRRIAWCTGGAQDGISEAIELGAHAYVSGEISERTTHIAREAGIAYFAAGHHATERYGVQAVGEAVAASLGLVHRFIDDDNPV